MSTRVLSGEQSWRAPSSGVGPAREIKGILKRLMGDLPGAFEDLTHALERIFKVEDEPCYIYNYWKHRDYVKFLDGESRQCRTGWKDGSEVAACTAQKADPRFETYSGRRTSE